jgi:nitroreductase
MALSLPSQTTEERAASDARARRQALRQVGRAAAGKVCASAGSVAGAAIHVMDAPHPPSALVCNDWKGDLPAIVAAMRPAPQRRGRSMKYWLDDALAYASMVAIVSAIALWLGALWIGEFSFRAERVRELVLSGLFACGLSVGLVTASARRSLARIGNRMEGED